MLYGSGDNGCMGGGCGWGVVTMAVWQVVVLVEVVVVVLESGGCVVIVTVVVL